MGEARRLDFDRRLLLGLLAALAVSVAGAQTAAAQA
jgi:hypothetical protein